MIPLVYIITLNWNKPHDTIECLVSLTQLTYSNFRLLVVDNCSTDNSVAIIQQKFPNIIILTNDTNLGFAAGINVGINYALQHGADYLLLINNDTHVAPNLLDELLKVANLHKVGMVTPKIFYAAKPTYIWSVGANQHPLTLEMTDNPIGQEDGSQWQTVMGRDYLVGCTLLITKEAIEKVGAFDERFFLYYEDLDLSIRMKQAGYRLMLAPQAHVWHKVSLSSGGRDSTAERYWMGRSSVIFFAKHTYGLRWLIVLPYRISSMIKTTLRLGLQGRKASMKAYLQGLIEGVMTITSIK